MPWCAFQLFKICLENVVDVIRPSHLPLELHTVASFYPASRAAAAKAAKDPFGLDLKDDSNNFGLVTVSKDIQSDLAERLQ